MKDDGVADLVYEKLEPLVIVPRDSWGAAPAKEAGPALATPLTCAVVTYSTETDQCSSEDQCAANMRDLQRKHMDSGMTDIAYNFVVAGDGKVYEGRGWNSQPSTPSFPDLNGKRLDVAYMGVANRESLEWEMYKPCIQLLQDEGVKKNYLDPDFKSEEDPLPLDKDARL